jgi:hypothetical protein
MTGLEYKDVKHRDYDAEVFLMINPQEKPFHWLLYWQAHYRGVQGTQGVPLQEA